MGDTNKVSNSSIRETSIGDYCANCDHYLDKSYKNCPNCGAQLEDDKEI